MKRHQYHHREGKGGMVVTEETDIGVTMIEIPLANTRVTKGGEYQPAGMPQMLRVAAEEVEGLEAQNVQFSQAQVDYSPNGSILRLFCDSLPSDHPLSPSGSSRADSR